jgi:hypothetical protein
MIQSVDPGGSIGWVRALPGPAPKLLDIVASGETREHMKFLDVIYQDCCAGLITQLVCETFRPMGGRARTWQPDALEQIGVIKWIAHRTGVPLAMQTPAEAREFSTAEKLALFRSDQVHGDDARMALRHIIRFQWIKVYG